MNNRKDLPSLLLLPAPPEPASKAALNAAYYPPLQTTLEKLHNSESSSVLIVAVVYPLLSGDGLTSKTLSWPDAQSLLAGLYTIVSAICAKESIETDLNGGPGSVDVRIILVHDDPSQLPTDYQPRIEPTNSCVPDLVSFATAYHPWNHIFHAESKPGLQLNAQYLKFAEGVQPLLNSQLVPVAGGLTMHVPGPAAVGSITTMALPTAQHSAVCLGGTFDHLHPGHKLLLTAAALLLRIPPPGSASPCTLIVGVTGDAMLRNKKFAAYMQPWAVRAQGVLDFLCSVLELGREGWQGRTGVATVEEQNGEIRATFRGGSIAVQCVRIDDAFGPTITVRDLGALVVSAESRAGGVAVNERRMEQGWPLLAVFEVDVLDTEGIAEGDLPPQEGFANKISSTAIRQRKAQASSISHDS